MNPDSHYQEINSYGLIGDMHTCALVGPNGSIDWCCLPYFDSPSVFGSLLDHEKGGEFRAAPVVYEKSYTSYLSRTNILQTVFLGIESRVSLYDFMPVLSEDGQKKNPRAVFICRIVECDHGAQVRLGIRFRPRPDYGLSRMDLKFSPQEVQATAAPMWLLSNHDISWDPDTGEGELLMQHGDRLVLVMAYHEKPPTDQVGRWGEVQFLRTRNFWESWILQSLYQGRWKAAVERSALALKLLTFKPTGAVLAAATTSLPEVMGGERNWDYRFSWLRDSALVLNALYLLGFQEEARAYVAFLKRCSHPGMPGAKVLLPIGETDTTPEHTLDHLEGYGGSRPVRIGNAASSQLQLDVAGAIIHTFFLHGIFADPIDAETWSFIRPLADEICGLWDQPDEGIWEVRDTRRHFTYSKLMCWTGLDRALRMAEEGQFQAELARWRQTRDSISSYLTRHCLHPEKGYFMQSPERPVADASTLLIPIMQFLPANNAFVQNTINEVRGQLACNGLIYRYAGEDGLDGIEGSFNICTFWLVEAMAMSNRLKEASEHFVKALESAGSCGLFSEETDPNTGQALGNYPQAFSHVGLINAALALNNELRKIGSGKHPL